jgi:hypothetical protein
MAWMWVWCFPRRHIFNVLTRYRLSRLLVRFWISQMRSWYQKIGVISIWSSSPIAKIQFFRKSLVFCKSSGLFYSRILYQEHRRALGAPPIARMVLWHPHDSHHGSLSSLNSLQEEIIESRGKAPIMHSDLMFFDFRWQNRTFSQMVRINLETYPPQFRAFLEKARSGLYTTPR